MTPAEELRLLYRRAQARKWNDMLWQQIQANKLDGWEREAKIIPDRDFRFDFANRRRMIAVEVQGQTWKKGGHTSGTGYQRDCDKANLAVCHGWAVLRFTGRDVKSGRAVHMMGLLVGFE